MENKKNLYIIIIILLIIIILGLGAFIAYIMINNQNSSTVDNNQINNVSGENSVETNSTNNDNSSTENKKPVKVEKEELIKSNSDKVHYNEILLEKNILLQYIINSKRDIKSGSYNSGRFSDKEKLLGASLILYNEHKEEFDSNSRNIDGPQYYVKKDILNKYSNYLFEEEINFANITDDQTNDEVYVGYGTGAGIYIYKVDSIELDSGIYTITIDSLAVNDTSKIANIRKADYTEYQITDIVETYKIKYKKIDSKYVLLSIEQTYKK